MKLPTPDQMENNHSKPTSVMNHDASFGETNVLLLDENKVTFYTPYNSKYVKNIFKKLTYLLRNLIVN